jgi:NAD(P)H-hydrate epimerase
MSTSLTREQVRQVDAIAIHELGIPGVVLMENAGRNATEHVLGLCARSGAKRILIFAGPGNNGGDGFVIARHLMNRGFNVRVYLTGEERKLSDDAGMNYRILRNMGVDVHSVHTPQSVTAALAEIRETDVVVDALLGTGFCGRVREPLATLIPGINDAAKAGAVAIDVPSGLDCNTGQPSNATIRADCTVTFVANKTGFEAPDARRYVGEVVVADIGTPPELVTRVLPG